ncbi:acyl-CoA dehydrogenase family protein [Pseudohalioglobus lutimaris]|uniref:Acyl-CoA dehydrogenase n=1 Tax=Pseudohalioglobus lutimaris TaxID=1737061 RepID=A0A2N5X8W5_9GAMM|nr:acyl-CoA dehydrogenase family protein [Pseudohalioglobus lutimaris]PLW70898.1 acyl-CoA dehydrogenase [Pseudohalioglobus lutimaris]
MNEELELFRENVRRFIEREIAPHYEQWERDEIFPREMWNKLGEQGLLCVDLPDEYGGAGATFPFSMVVLEEFSRANFGALGGPITVHSDIVAHYILNNGCEEQKRKYLPGFASGECVGAVAMTEPGAGSDLQGVRTTAKREGDEWVLNGSKTFITNGQHCDVVIVVARTNLEVSGAKGSSLFLVDRDTPGFSRGRNLEKIGLHASDTSELFFEDVRLPASALLGELDGGFAVLMKELPRERLVLALGAVAAAEGVMTEAVAYCKQRQAFGAPIAALQNTRFKLAELATKVRVNRAFVLECTQLYLRGELDAATVSMAKLASTEMQGEVADGCLQLYGGYGYMREYGVSRAFVDARVQRIYGGTSEIMKELISRAVLA